MNIAMASKLHQIEIPVTARVVYAVRSNGMWCVHWIGE